jgi:hypothetical protein
MELTYLVQLYSIVGIICYTCIFAILGSEASFLGSSGGVWVLCFGLHFELTYLYIYCTLLLVAYSKNERRIRPRAQQLLIPNLQ